MSNDKRDETPRTDALFRDKPGLWDEWDQGDLAQLEAHARQLERELAATEACRMLELRAAEAALTPSSTAANGQNVGTSQQLPTERHTDFVDVAVMREALEDDMGRKRLPDAVRDAIYWLEAGGRRSVADMLDSWARDERDGYLGLKGTTDALLRDADRRIADMAGKLDAISEVLEMPKESWRIAGCDVLAHQVRDLLANYIRLRETVTTAASGEKKP